MLHDAVRLLTGSAADFLDDYFESDILKGYLASSSIIGTKVGPYSQGSGLVLLYHFIGEHDGVFGAWAFHKRGNGGFTQVLARAARALGAEIVLESPVANVITKNGRATGVALADGGEYHADIVVSAIDPRRTFLELVDPLELPTDLVDNIRRFRFQGTSSKVNFALDGLPKYPALGDRGDQYRGFTNIGPSMEYLEHAFDDAKYGWYSQRPYLDCAIQSTIDPDMAPPGKHVMSCFVQYAPYKLRESDWDTERENMADTVQRTLESFFPGFGEPRPPARDPDAARHRADGRPVGGQHLCRRVPRSADVLLPPGAGLVAVPDPDRRLLPVRLGNASRRLRHGRAGQARRRPDPQGPQQAQELMRAGLSSSRRRPIATNLESWALLSVNTPVTICHPVVARDEPGTSATATQGRVLDVSEQWSQFDSEQASPDSNSTDASSANGVSQDYAIGVAEPPGEDATATDGELTADATTDEEVTDDAPVAAIEAAADAPAETSDDGAAAPAADDGSAFLAELARAMQAAAGLERIRIGEDIDRRRQDEIDRVQARKAAEADRMRELAAEDMAAIDAWVDRETARIHLDRESRATAVREDLETSLAEHGSKIDREIEGLESAIATYRGEVEAYFEGLDGETDPTVIAQKASKRPAFPALEAVGEPVAEAPADAAEPAPADEPVAVGVMDPAAPAEPVESWAAPAEAGESSNGVHQDGAAPNSEEAAHAQVSATIGGPGALLQSVPAKRPMSWLRRSDD